MAEKSNMPYLAIVVLVAVVAVVVLVLNFRPSSEEAVAGEATKTFQQLKTVKQVCPASLKDYEIRVGVVQGRDNQYLRMRFTFF